MDVPHAVAVPKERSMRFVKRMFKDRGYRTDIQQTVQDSNQKMWQIFTETQDGKRVLAVFAACKPFGDVMQVEEYVERSEDVEEAEDFDTSSTAEVETFEGAEKSGKAASQNAGMDFVKNIVKFSIEQNIAIVILVTDFMTPRAQKHIAVLREVSITHFTYAETGIARLHDHILQPVVFRALEKKEREEYIQQHPRYEKEIMRYSVNDCLVKYYGMHVGDIVYIEDNDRQTASVIEYGMVVEEL